ncbi:MAG: CDP-alcohol phosphatidyltransferase family protein [Chloroflexi bacterium]|nr:CDP-alcohol phosphatidyltransferase family protein [Chloroflexota bacterium]MBP8056600.1 CDP-alcohol phosphatidyltransferase family protein [Chloroflexota bacterium]
MEPVKTHPITSAPQPRVTLTDHLRARTAIIINPTVEFLARWRFTPDGLTITGMLFHFFFAWLIATGHSIEAGIAIMFIAPLDALDGALARKLGRKQGGFGAFLDSTLDRLAEIILFGGYMLYFSREGAGLWQAVAYLAITGSLMVSYARSRAEALNLECKIGIASRVERYIIIIVTLLLNLPEVGLLILAVTTYITLVQRIWHVWKQTRPAE